MTFKRTDFSPVGAQARAGVAPQKFSYASTDALSAIKTNGYFPRDNDSINDPPGINGMLGVFNPNDIVSVVSDVPAAPSATKAPKHDVVRIAGDGRGAGAATAVTAGAGSGMSAGDLAKVIYTDGIVLRNTIIRINDATGSAVTLEDPGQFDLTDVPTSLTGLAYELLDGAAGTEGTVTITTTSKPDITVWTKDISEA